MEDTDCRHHPYGFQSFLGVLGHRDGVAHGADDSGLLVLTMGSIFSPTGAPIDSAQGLLGTRLDRVIFWIVTYVCYV